MIFTDASQKITRTGRYFQCVWEEVYEMIGYRPTICGIKWGKKKRHRECRRTSEMRVVHSHVPNTVYIFEKKNEYVLTFDIYIFISNI